ncbi:hypothetical protein CEK60_21755 [Halomonas sp. N3-2A]|nr:hypothetical protein CEK60_21755 [Halomonas sp. N3-2A]
MGHLFRDDPGYADKARRVSEHTRDLAEVLAAENLDALAVHDNRRLAFQCPCTLQHGQRLAGATESLLTRLGFDLTPVPDAHLCCGSAGTYSITQPDMARQLRDNTLDALESGAPDLIATANIGCQMHLAAAARTPVRHWIEIVDEGWNVLGAAVYQGALFTIKWEFLGIISHKILPYLRTNVFQCIAEIGSDRIQAIKRMSTEPDII